MHYNNVQILIFSHPKVTVLKTSPRRSTNGVLRLMIKKWVSIWISKTSLLEEEGLFAMIDLSFPFIIYFNVISCMSTTFVMTDLGFLSYFLDISPTLSCSFLYLPRFLLWQCKCDVNLFYNTIHHQLTKDVCMLHVPTAHEFANIFTNGFNYYSIYTNIFSLLWFHFNWNLCETLTNSVWYT